VALRPSSAPVPDGMRRGRITALGAFCFFKSATCYQPALPFVTIATAIRIRAVISTPPFCVCRLGLESSVLPRCLLRVIQGYQPALPNATATRPIRMMVWSACIGILVRLGLNFRLLMLAFASARRQYPKAVAVPLARPRWLNSTKMMWHIVLELLQNASAEGAARAKLSCLVVAWGGV